MGYLLLIIVILFGVSVFRWTANRRAKGPLAGDPGTTSDDFIKWLSGYESWYTRASWKTHRILEICRIAPIVIGFFVAIISSVNMPTVSFYYWQISTNLLVIILTGISTTCVSVLGQLRIADLARAREIGRINCARLVADARLKLFDEGKNPSDVQNEKLSIKDTLFRIEHDQAALYAALGSRPTNSAST